MTNSAYRLYIGSYAAKDEEGITYLAMDRASGSLSKVGSASGIENASYLTIHPSQPKLYSVSETDDSELVVFSMDPETGALQPEQRLRTGGGLACYLHVESEQRCLLAVNYDTGNVLAYELDEAGSVSRLGTAILHEGSGPRTDRQERAHPHCILPDPNNRYVVVPDLGTDQVVVYSLHSPQGHLVYHDAVQVKPGAGPRHFAFHPRLPFAYVINELDSTINAFRYDADEGRLETIQTISTLPDDFQGESTCAHIQISADGAFVYGSNRGHDSIAVYRIDERRGTLALVQIIGTGGRMPRNFSLSPDGRYLVAANQDSGNVVVFTVDQATGELSPTEHMLEVPSPAFVRFER